MRTLWFDRPGSSQNTLGTPTLDELDDCLRRANADLGTRVLVVRSGKPRGFCAGADLKELQGFATVAEAEAFGRRGLSVFARLARRQVPTVALIHGVCLGGGLELALACRHRLAVADDSTKLGTPEVLLGLVPGWGAITDLPRLVGLSSALDLLLGGQPVDADDAARIGLVDGLLDPKAVEDGLARFLDAPTSRHPTDWPPLDWESMLDVAWHGLSTSTTAEPSLARRRLLEIVATDIRHGPDAGREEAVVGLAALLQTPTAREALAAFCTRSGSRAGEG